MGEEWIYRRACAWAQVMWGRRWTCGFCRNVCLWLAQPPQRFSSGSAFLVQLPKCTTSLHVLWILRWEVLIRRQTSASVKNLHQSVNDILWMQTGHVWLHYEGGDKLHRWTTGIQKTFIHSPELSIILHCDAEVSSLHIADLWPLLRANRQRQSRAILMHIHYETPTYTNK